MMDAMAITGGLTLPTTSAPVVALLPGSREDAYVNLNSLAAVLERLADPGGATGLVPLAPGLDVARAAEVLLRRGWGAAADERPSGEGGAGGRRDAAFQKGRAFLWVLQGAFGDVLHAADAVVGLAGTANEQAAGLGKPVVAFPGPGVQFGPRFLHSQRLLLGDALAVVPPSPEAVAAEVRAILRDPARRERHGGGRPRADGSARRRRAHGRRHRPAVGFGVRRPVSPAGLPSVSWVRPPPRLSDARKIPTSTAQTPWDAAAPSRALSRMPAI